MNTNIHKIILVGGHQVGKSALINRFISEEFSVTYTKTIGIEFQTKCITLDGSAIKCQIWDLSGHYMDMCPRYFMIQMLRSLCSKGHVGIMVVYDVNDVSSLDSVDHYLDILCDIKKEFKVCVMLVGNKCDEREYTSDEDFREESVQKYLKHPSCDICMETCAKYGYNVEQAFISLVATSRETSDSLNNSNKSPSTVKIASRRIKIDSFDGCNLQ